MTLTLGIPSTGQSLGQTRDTISANFSNYNNVVSQDHVSPNSSGQGKHNKSTYVVQGSDPVTIASEIAVYAKLLSGVPALFQRQQNGGAINPLVTFLATNSVTIAGTPQTQYSINIGGIDIRYGFAFNCANNTTINFSPNFASSCNAVFLTISDPNPTPITLCVASNPTTGSFSIKSSANISFYYLALGT